MAVDVPIRRKYYICDVVFEKFVYLALLIRFQSRKSPRYHCASIVVSV